MTEITFTAPLAAYRADLRGRSAPLSADDGDWLHAGSELHLASRAHTASGRRAHLYAAIGIGIDVLGDQTIAAFAEREWRGQRAYCDSLLILAEAIHYEGAIRLAAVMLDDLRRAATDMAPVHAGRVLALRAKLAWKLGALEEAADRYDRLVTESRRQRLPDVEALAELGLSTLAQLRGDFPDLRERAPRIHVLAERSGNRAVVRWAHTVSMMTAIGQADLDGAIHAGWRSWELSQGHDIWEAEALTNLGQLMLEAGHLAQARAGFASALSRKAPARLLLPALGGLALASARLGNEATVEWTVREVWRAASLSVSKYEIAAAHLECALALQILGRSVEAMRHRASAEVIARQNRFHEVAFKAGEMERHDPLTHAPLDRPSEVLASQLIDLEPDRLPHQVHFANALL